MVMRDEFLEVMSKSVDKWMLAKPEVNIFGNDIGGDSDYISILYRESDDLHYSFLNGFNDEVMSKSRDSGYSVRVMMGDSEQGYGSARSARGEVPRESALLGKLMDANLDLTIKGAMASYLGIIIGNIVYEKDVFVKLSKDKSEVFFDNNNKIFVDNHARDAIRNFTGLIYKSGLVGEASAVVKTSFNVKRFVDS